MPDLSLPSSESSLLEFERPFAMAFREGEFVIDPFFTLADDCFGFDSTSEPDDPSSLESSTLSLLSIAFDDIFVRAIHQIEFNGSETTKDLWNDLADMSHFLKLEFNGSTSESVSRVNQKFIIQRSLGKQVEPRPEPQPIRKALHLSLARNCLTSTLLFPCISSNIWNVCR